MQVKVSRGQGQFSELKRRWDDLVSSDHEGLPFYSWAWYWTWWKHFADRGDLFIVTGEDAEGRLTFVAPLMKRRAKLHGLGVSEIRFMENAIGPRNAILCRRDAAVEAGRAVVDCLADHRREWDIVTLSGVEDDAAYLAPMRDRLGERGMGLLEETGRRSPYVELGADFDRYLHQRFNRKHRYNVRRSVKMLMDRPGCSITCYSRPADTAAALEQAFIVSKASWKGTANSDMAGSPARRAFYADLTAQMAQAGLVQIWVLELAGCPIAVQYQLVSDRGVHLLVSDFAENRRELSPGTVLLYHAIERLCEDGGKEFDFCGDAYDYKMAWATGVRRHVNIQLFNQKPYSRFIYVAKSRILPLLRKNGGGAEAGGNVPPVPDQE